MPAERLVLYSDAEWTSPYVLSCFVTLRVKGIDFEARDVELRTSEQKNDGYRQRSLTSRVPCLEHGEFSLSESSAIVEYLEEQFPAPNFAAVLPRDREERARARQVMAWLRSDLMPLREERPTTTIFYAPTDAPLSMSGRLARSKLLDAANQLLASDRGQLFSEWCIADVELTLMLQRLAKNGDELPAALQRFIDRQWQHPAVQEFARHPRKQKL